MMTEFTPEYIALVEAHYKEIKNGPLTPTELKIFLERAKTAQLDPLSGQILPTIRKSEDNGKWKRSLVFMTTIDALRLIADRTGQYTPGQSTQFGPNDPAWAAPEWANVYVKKFAGGMWHEYSGTAYFGEYVQLLNDKKTATSMWKKMPRTMIAKCAEALALRRGFPAELSGLYAFEELDQAENDVPSEPKFGEAPRKVVTATAESEERVGPAVATQTPLDVTGQLSATPYIESADAFARLKQAISLPIEALPKSILVPKTDKRNEFQFGHNAKTDSSSAGEALLPPSEPQVAQPPTETVKVPEKPSQKKITPAQRARLFAIAKKGGRPEADLKAFLKTFGIDSSTNIPAHLYDTVIRYAEGK